MKNIIIVLILLAMVIPSAAETGIIVNASGYVEYKSAVGRPSLQEGEIFVPYEDINSVLRGAKYDGVSFVNPLSALEPEEKRAIKDNYLQTRSDIESAKTDLAIIRNQTNMTEAQQTNNIRKLADYEYKIFDILGTILRFLKLVFWSN